MAAKKSKAGGLNPAATARERLGPPPDVSAPGLVWQPRRASWSPIWKTTVDWPHKKNVNLSRFADRPDLLVAECVALNEKVAAWQAGVRGPAGFLKLKSRTRRTLALARWLSSEKSRPGLKQQTDTPISTTTRKEPRARGEPLA